MNSKKNYILVLLIIISSVIFSVIGAYWNNQYYRNNTLYSPSNPPLAAAMRGLHDKLYLSDFFSATANFASENLNLSYQSVSKSADMVISSFSIPDITTAFATASLIDNNSQFLSDILSKIKNLDIEALEAATVNKMTYRFTTATDDYFSDACFIGDSRTVGISTYANIENATFLCKSSLSIYDYDKPKIVFEEKKTSIRDVLLRKSFAKIYIMVGINECGFGTPEGFYKRYSDVISDIRKLQPDALIFIQGNLLVTEDKSNDGSGITNENIMARNELISTLANQRDIFYIDINESSLCEDDALLSDYTWDQVHIKAQYYPVWKKFLLEHAIIKTQPVFS